MLSTRWQPLLEVQSEMNRLRDEMDRLFGRWTHRRLPVLTQGVFPPLNVWEDDAHLYVEAELPGMALDALEIFVNGNQLTIKGERHEPACEKGSWHRRERACGKFARMFELPAFVDADQVRAEMKQGVLKVTLPKRPESRPRRIEVHSE
jgi:HSP20 family protein